MHRPSPGPEQTPKIEPYDLPKDASSYRSSYYLCNDATPTLPST